MIKKGQHISPATEFKKGMIPWSKGKKRPDVAGKNNPMYGRPTYGHLGHPHSEKTKKMVSEMFKGRKLSEEWRKKISQGNMGKVFSEETRRKISLSKMGERNPAWKGGKGKTRQERNLREMHEWSAKVLRRDRFICQKCGCRGGRLNAHHILPFAKYPELRLVVSNGITWCECCHKKYHHQIAMFFRAKKHYEPTRLFAESIIAKWEAYEN